MGISESLQGLRGSDTLDSSAAPAPEGDAEAMKTPRIIRLSGEELKAIGEGEPGSEMQLQVTGKLEGDHFHIMSVSAGDAMGMDDDAQAVAEGSLGGPPMVGM